MMLHFLFFLCFLTYKGTADSVDYVITMSSRKFRYIKNKILPVIFFMYNHLWIRENCIVIT